MNLIYSVALAALVLMGAPSVLAGEMVKLQQINAEVNMALEYRAEDLTQWASPSEALARGYGACVEYALTKWSKAVKAGIPESKLRLAYGKAGDSAHMWLVYLDDPEDPMVFDNLQAPKRQSAREDLRVTFHFDRTKLYAGGKTFPASRYGQWASWLRKNANELESRG